MTTRSAVVPIALDVLVVLAFAAVGRSNHDEGLTVTGVAGTAWPFLLGLAFGWLAAWSLGDGTAVRAGVAVWVGTVGIGMLLRTLGGDPPPASFVLVAAVVLGVGLVGWRAVYALVVRRSAPTA